MIPSTKDVSRLIPLLGLVHWRSPSLGYAEKGRVGRLSRRPSGHGGFSVPMNRWANAGRSIDGHLPTASTQWPTGISQVESGRRYRRVYPHAWRGMYGPGSGAENESASACEEWGRFFADWKKQRLVLLRKGNKPLGDASSYRPICLLDTMGKLLEEMILQSLQGHMVRENGLSENQFGFRKGRSTVDAIQAVVDIATKARRGTGKRKGFCALISIDIRKAFNTARWSICIEAMVRKKVPDYLLRMIECGASQGSRVGPLVWNVMYDDFLRMDLPAGMSIIGFADDALVVCAADNVGILELRINDTLWRAKRWLDSRGLKMAPEKTRLCSSRTGDPPNIRGSFSGNMKSSGKRALSTWEYSWIEGLASANTCRSRLPKPSNVGPP